LNESSRRDDFVKHGSPESGVLQAHVGVMPVLSESNFEALAGQLKVGVFIYGVDGRTLYVNQAISRMSGYATSELLALPAKQRYARPEELECFIEQLVKHGCVQNFAAVALRKDGTHYHTLMSAVVVRTETGEPEYVVGTTEDMTEHRRAEEALRLVMRSLDAGQESAYWFEPAGNIVYANAAGCAALGYTRDELLKLNVADINPQVTRERWADEWSAFRGNRSITFESEFRRKDGSCFPVEVRGTYFESNGKEYFHGYAKDLTELRRAENERKTMQEQLLHAQKMESVGRLAGGIAHDFNNMLGVILGESELCLDAIDADSPLRVDLEQIRDATLRSVDLTRQLLAFARRQSTEPKVLDLNETISDMFNMTRRLIGEGVELEWLPGNSLWLVCIDPTQINQLLANLCVNARDANKGTGTITIATQNTSFGAERASSDRHGDYVRLAVTDTGVGMSEATMSRVFEPFFTTKELGHGSGLGLASVHGIVTQNQGLPDVQTSPGKGTTFSVYLPRHHEER
jgi:two-component system, cell cycle sensor histidine kinase and response regulator CckA